LTSWILKAAIQKALSPLPAGHALNRLFQVRVTGSLDLTGDRTSAQMGRCARHLEAYAGSAGRIPHRVLEVGTGWHPLLPIGFHLCGCGEIRTVDRAPLLTRSLIRRTLEAVARKIRDGSLRALLPRLVPERAAGLLESLERLKAARGRGALEPLGISYQIVGRAGLAVGAADLVVTNSVLEHLEEQELRALLGDLRRAIVPDGVASHFVDLGDHYAVFDRSIDVYNFLRFSDRAWGLINSRLHHQSRLRISDYRRSLTEAGWSLREESSQRGTVADLEKIPLAPRVRRYSLEDLLVYRSWIRAVPAG
jgi:hypothetical protein